MRTRLGILAIAAMMVLSAFPMGALGYQELELQAATDTLQVAGRDTVEQLFWRSGFGASVIGGPTIGGNAGAFSARQTLIEGLASGTTPTGARPIFIEFAQLANASYVAGTVNATDYATQRWNFTAGARTTGAATLGAGAAADAALASYLLRTNHYANGTQSPAGPYLGATGADGVLGLWNVDALIDRVSAITMYGAYNGSALGAFNLTDANLNDADGTNGWQLVPDGLGVSLSSDPEPLFQGFTAANNATGLRGTAYLILGLSEIVALSDPAGDHAWLFDSDPYDASLYNNSQALLVSIVANNDAAHWDATAMTYTNGGAGTVDTGDLALLVTALAGAEAAVGDAARPAVTAARERALTALTSLSDAFGAFPATYDVAGATVTGNWSMVSLWAQAGALEAVSSVYRTTGLVAHMKWMMKASAGLESVLFSAGSYHAVAPEPALSTFTAGAVGLTFGGLRDLALTGEEPLAIWRLVNATQWLFNAPPLMLAGATHPPVIGASFVWNATSLSYAPQVADFSSWSSLLAAYELLSIGPEFLTAVGGGVSTTESASLRLHNATASEVGATIDGLDAQIAALNGQLAALQASFDALNANVTAITDNLTLSLENESINAARIAGLQANLTTLRANLNNTVENLTTVQALFDNSSTRYGDLQKLYNESNINLTAALQNATTLAGEVNKTIDDLMYAQTAMKNQNDTLAKKTSELSYAQGTVALAALGGLVVGIAAFWFLQRFVMAPKSDAPKEPTDKKGSSKKDEEDHDNDEESEDDD